MDTQPTTGISRVPCLPNAIHLMSYDTRLTRETAGKLEVYVPLLRFILTKKGDTVAALSDNNTT
jgi:hypothetical protein